MKEGLFFEEDNLIYYENGEPKHAGIVKIDDAIYYIGSKGRAVKGEYIVHRSMANGILPRGTYTFGDDYKLVEGSYVAPDVEKAQVKTEAATKIKAQKQEQKKPKLKLRNVVLAACLLSCLLGGVIVYENLYKSQIPVTIEQQAELQIERQPEAQPEPIPIVTVQPVTMTLPVFEEEVLLCSQEAKQTYERSIAIVDAISSGAPYRPCVFEYDLAGSIGVMLLSEDARFRNSEAYVLQVDLSALPVDNLKTGTTYYYKILVADQEFNGSFRTAQTPRFVTIPGGYNTRDIGGYVTLDGKTVKQGLLIRGTEIDGLVIPEYTMPASAREEVQHTFGFVYDMDLRDTSLESEGYQSPLGEEVTHRFYHSPQYEQIFNAEWKNSLRQIFADLADADKYPMYLHCSWGQDRTGTIIFLLQGLLNVSLDDMLYEYHLSGFHSTLLADADYMNPLIAGLEPYEGDTIQEKIYHYLTTFVGVTENEIEAIRSIFLSE